MTTSSTEPALLVGRDSAANDTSLVVDAPNNGMHPTANSEAFIRKTGRIGVECAVGDAERWAASRNVERQMSASD